MSIVADLVPSVSIDAILMRRALLREAIEGVLDAYAKAADARVALFGGGDFMDESEERYRGSRSMSYDLRMEWNRTRRDIADKGELEGAFKRIDSECWAHLLAKSGLRQLMDSATRTQWDKQLSELEMPDFTEANIVATFTDLGARRGDIFADGVVAVFEKLSFDYQTNTPVKFGKRLVITHAVETHTHSGKTSVHGPAHRFCDNLDDLVRAFCVLEGKPEPSHTHGAWALLREQAFMEHNYSTNKPAAKEAEIPGYASIRGFKNGNAHVTFLRPDLVDKLNQIIAKRFPNALPPSRDCT